MGCFNTTGFVSQLPILDEDKVICFIATVKTDSPNGLYYPSSCTDGIIGRNYEGQITPYLRSLWTMTKEEYNQVLFKHCNHSYITDPFKLTNIKTFTPQLLNWLYKKQFNINLPEELYLELPEFMYNN